MRKYIARQGKGKHERRNEQQRKCNLSGDNFTDQRLGRSADGRGEARCGAAGIMAAGGLQPSHLLWLWFDLLPVSGGGRTVAGIYGCTGQGRASRRIISLSEGDVW